MRLSYNILRVSYQVFRLSYRENRLSGFAFIVYQVLRLSDLNWNTCVPARMLIAQSVRFQLKIPELMC